VVAGGFGTLAAAAGEMQYSVEAMSSVMLRRRPDGIVQIRPRPLWRAIAGPVPAAILGMLLACSLLLILLTAALIRFPVVVLLVFGCVFLGLAAVRWGLTEPKLAERGVHRHPPGNAA
jgi:hypothetical protein